MLRKNKSLDEALGAEPFQALVGKNTSIDGRITFSECIRIDGRVNGDVELERGASGAVAVGPDAEVRGNITARRVLVAGVVVGNIHASESAHLLATAQVTGDVTYGTLSVSPGARVNGMLNAVVEEKTSKAGSGKLACVSGHAGAPALAGEAGT